MTSFGPCQSIARCCSYTNAPRLLYPFHTKNWVCRNGKKKNFTREVTLSHTWERGRSPVLSKNQLAVGVVLYPIILSIMPAAKQMAIKTIMKHKQASVNPMRHNRQLFHQLIPVSCL